MNIETSESKSIKKYLLGQAAEADSLQLEERLISDETFFNELSIAEDELVDEYLGGKLSETDRNNFEEHFLSAAERQRKLRFARSLKKYVNIHAGDTNASAQASDPVLASSQPVKSSTFPFFAFRNPLLGYSLAAAVVLAALVGTWYLLKTMSNTGDPGKVFVATLTPGLIRDSQTDNKITIPSDAHTVRLQLLLTQDAYRAFEAVVQDSTGQTITTKQNLPIQSANGQLVVFVDIPSNVLRPGDYRVKLTGLTTDNVKISLESYSFTVFTPGL